jgi:hypothetical protein
VNQLVFSTDCTVVKIFKLGTIIFTPRQIKLIYNSARGQPRSQGLMGIYSEGPGNEIARQCSKISIFVLIDLMHNDVLLFSAGSHAAQENVIIHKVYIKK